MRHGDGFVGVFVGMHPVRQLTGRDDVLAHEYFHGRHGHGRSVVVAR